LQYTKQEVLEFVAENDVKFIRLSFCDLFGTLKNIAIMASQLERAFAQGISFDGSAVKGFMNVSESDLLLFPIPETLAILPWRPQQGKVARLFCEIRYPGGAPFEGDCRSLLCRSVEEASRNGYLCNVGAECEFYLFQTDDRGEPTYLPQDRAGYCDLSPQDRGENVRREICLTLEEMGFQPQSSHHEQGPGQNEVVFAYSDALTAADNLITFKAVVRTVAARSGLFASFLPKPLKEASGSGLHVNLSLFSEDGNLFEEPLEDSAGAARHFIAGILRRARELSIFLNPIPNSYGRFGAYEAPKYVTWSRQNRSQLVRIPAAKGEYSRMELRSPDPSCNPYLVFALLLEAGMEGVREELPLPPPADFDLYRAPQEKLGQLELLPKDMGEAIELCRQSQFVKKVLPARMLEKYLEYKNTEWWQFLQAKDADQWEEERYFRVI